MRNTRIIFTGAQGTGKTTLMNILKTDNIKSLSIARKAAIKNNGLPSDKQREQYQKDLFSTAIEMLSDTNYISDRGLTCITAYTCLGVLNGSISRDLAYEQYETLKKFHYDNPDILVVYTPIEFDIIPDGVRSTDKEHQANVDFMIKSILDNAGINYITVSGSVDERISQIEVAIKNLNNEQKQSI
jgi:predicted ATPase